MTARLVVIDLDAVPGWLEDVLYLRDPSIYRGVLSGETLRHLAHLADDRERSDAAKLATLLATAPLALGAFRGAA